MQVKHLLVVAAVAGAGAFGVAQLGGDNGEPDRRISAASSATTTTLAAVGADGEPRADAAPEAAGETPTQPVPATGPATAAPPPTSEPGSPPPTTPPPSPTTTAAPTTTTTTAEVNEDTAWCTITVPASASVGSTITAVLHSNVPDRVAVIDVSPSSDTDDRYGRGMTDGSGTFSYTFDVRVGDDGVVSGLVPFEVGGEPWAECTARYTAA